MNAMKYVWNKMFGTYAPDKLAKDHLEELKRLYLKECLAVEQAEADVIKHAAQATAVLKGIQRLEAAMK